MISIFTASFIPFIIISTLIFFHECGHFIIAKLFKVEVDKIYLYPFGGISKFNMSPNISLKKEFLILIAGPLAQEITKNILLILLPEYGRIIIAYHYGILFFNLLPIYPLDGGKLVNLLLSKFFPLKKSFTLSIYIGYLTLILLFLVNINNLNLNIIIIIIFLIYKLIYESRQINYLYQKFLLERYLNNYKFKDTKIIKNKDQFYRNNKHLLKIGDKYYYEKEFLSKIYKKS